LPIGSQGNGASWRKKNSASVATQTTSDDAGNYFGEECKTALGLGELKAAGYDASGWAVIEGFNDGIVLTAAGGSFPPNGLGIYDLGGNVWEWCQDDYEPGSGLRVLRGGSWGNGIRGSVLSSNRFNYDPDNRYENVGFRAVVEAGSGR
jgi:formylglycine-generating enzyme required for sulfatase activity